MALVASLIIFCFENMLGDTDRAVRNIQSALDIVHEYLEEQKTTSSRTQPNPVSFPIEEEILSAFLHLDRPAAALLGGSHNESAPVSSRRLGLGSTFCNLSYAIPSRLGSVPEARKYLELIRYRIVPKQKPESDLPTTFTASGDIPGVVDFLKSFTNSAIYNHTEELLLQFAQWHRAFEELFIYAKTQFWENIFLSAQILHIHSLPYEMLLQGFGEDFQVTKMPKSNFQLAASPSSILTHPSYVAAREILALSGDLVKHPKFRKTFTFEVGIIPCLWNIVLMCPNRELKQQSTEILKSIEGRVECVWDAKTVAEAGKKVLASYYVP